MSVIYRVTFSGEDPYFRCDGCKQVLPGRSKKQTNPQSGQEENINMPPIGWMVPRRAGEPIQSPYQTEIYCSFVCLAKHDGAPEETYASDPPMPEPVREIAKASELPPEPGQYGKPTRLVDARR